MNNKSLYALAAFLTIIGLGLTAYKTAVIGFPLSPKTETRVWSVEARVRFVGRGEPAKVTMFIPGSSGGFALADEKFISQGYGFVISQKEGNRQATWSVRKASGKQNLYYEAAVVNAPQTEELPPQKEQKEQKARKEQRKRTGIECRLDGPRLDAAKAILSEVEPKSADQAGLVQALIKKLNEAAPGDNVKLLFKDKPTGLTKTKVAVQVLGCAGVKARTVRGIPLTTGHTDFTKKTPILAWLEVYEKGRWVGYHPLTGASPVPDHWFRWWTGPGKIVEVEGGADAVVTVSVRPEIEEAIAGAIRRGQIASPLLLKFSLLSLPLDTQAVYRIMLLVPVGALLLVLLRNVVGVKTFGTFMPVLIALSFRETGLIKGIFLITALVAVGLAIRFYLERLKLLAVPRLAAVLIVVVLLMGFLSIITHRLGGQTGLSVALFPMVIITMTIERMSVVWEERGAGEALMSGAGSLLTAALAFVVMKIKIVEHLVFVFPELLLVALAAVLLLGRYTGYRLTDLYRFRELAKG